MLLAAPSAISASARHSPEHFIPMRGVLSAQAGIHVSVPGAELTTLGSIYQLTPYPSRLLRLP